MQNAGLGFQRGEVEHKRWLTQGRGQDQGQSSARTLLDATAPFELQASSFKLRQCIPQRSAQQGPRALILFERC
jgi:hypothetical protein